MSNSRKMSEPPRFFVGPEDAEINPGNYRRFFHHAEEEEEEEDESPPERQIVVGICSMAKKSKSKPMKEILERISLFKYITVVVFEEEIILNEPVENWPLCDCLISFHSKEETCIAFFKLKASYFLGSHCAGLFSTSVLGGSSSAPNLQDYARTHRKKLTSSGCIDDATRGSAVKRFSISFARHPTNGFELYSMVPSICPLETLHNALFLKQVDDFLASIASPSTEVLRKVPEMSSMATRSSPGMRRNFLKYVYTYKDPPNTTCCFKEQQSKQQSSSRRTISGNGSPYLISEEEHK